jgi:hypothetical protein
VASSDPTARLKPPGTRFDYSFYEFAMHRHESIETTQICLHADMAMKEKALARTTDLKTTPKRYRPNDRLLAYLESL